jgi:uncharacterized protein (TIGR03118 family)
MTSKLLKKLKRILSGFGQVHAAASENCLIAERSAMDPNCEWIALKEMPLSKEGHKMSFPFSMLNMFVVLSALTIITSGCQKLRNEFFDQLPPSVVKPAKYLQTNLVSDTVSNNASRLDSTLVNAWGIAINPNGIIWVNSNGPGVSELYDMNGVPKRAPIKVPTPSGIVFNSTTDFIIPATSEISKFIFSSEDGKIYAWASGDSARTVVDRSAENSVYKGLELANDGTGNFLFATDFHNGKIDVFDQSFNLVGTKPFTDPAIPAGFAPFNVRLIDSVLYVTYAKQLAPDNHDDEKGPGNGYVNIFSTDGSLLRRFVSRGKLNSPWGIEKAPEGFGQGKNVILIGNFGDGRINVFEEGEGEYLRHLESHGMPVTIDGLWGITFPDNRIPGDDPNKLYFTAGPNDESHGLFGYLTKQ